MTKDIMEIYINKIYKDYAYEIPVHMIMTVY